MTEKQEQVFTQMEQLSREHFDGSLLIISARSEDDKQDETRCTWHGGYALAVGLGEIAKLQVWNKQQIVIGNKDGDEWKEKE